MDKETTDDVVLIVVANQPAKEVVEMHSFTVGTRAIPLTD